MCDPRVAGSSPARRCRHFQTGGMMPLTERQRELRRRHLHASDMPCIMGLSPYASEVDSQISKQRHTIDVETASTRPGNVLESVLVGLTAKRLRARPSRANLFRVSERNPIFGATHDAWIVGRPTEAIETKLGGGDYADRSGGGGASGVPAAALRAGLMQ